MFDLKGGKLQKCDAGNADHLVPIWRRGPRPRGSSVRLLICCYGRDFWQPDIPGLDSRYPTVNRVDIPDLDHDLLEGLWLDFDVDPALYFPHLSKESTAHDMFASQRRVVTLCMDNLRLTAQICSQRQRPEEKLGMYLPFESMRSALIIHSGSHATAEQLPEDLRPF
jgi:hypothetical protein